MASQLRSGWDLLWCQVPAPEEWGVHPMRPTTALGRFGACEMESARYG